MLLLAAFGGPTTAQPPPEVVTLTGQLLAEGTDEPLPNVTIHLTLQAEEGELAGLGGQATTDAEGRFTFEDIAEGTYQLSIQDPRCQPHQQTVKVCPGQTEPLVVHVPRLKTIRGRLLKADGTPLANAEIRPALKGATYEGGMRIWPGLPMRTDPEGNYDIPVGGPGTYTLVLMAPGAGYARAEDLAAGDKDLIGVDLILKPGASVSGSLVEKGTGKPVPNVPLGLLEPDPQGQGLQLWGQTDEAGRFTFRDLPPGSYRLWFSLTEHLSPPEQRLELAEGQAPENLVVEVAPAPMVRGRLLDLNGGPLANRPVNFQAVTRTAPNMRRHWGPPATTTDENGGFSFRAMQLGRTEIRVLLADLGYGATEFEAREGTDVEGLELRLQPLATLSGLVREKRTKEPLAGIGVRLSSEGGEWFPGPQPQATSDAEGRFQMANVIPGSYRFYVEAEGYQYDPERRVQIPAEGEPEELVIELERGTPVRGQVLQADGQPLADATVRVGQLERRTDVQGRFEFESVLWGDEVSVEAEGLAPATRAIRLEGADHPVELTLTLRFVGGTVAGQVRATETGEPLAGATVLAVEASRTHFMPNQTDYLRQQLEQTQRQGGRFDPKNWVWMGLKIPATATTDADGRYELTHVPEGRYTVYAFAPGRELGVREDLAVAEERKVRDVDFALARRDEKPAPRIAGRITGPDGEPLANASVHYRISTPSGSTSSSLETDGEGRYAIDLKQLFGMGLSSPETLTLAVQPEGYKIAQRDNLQADENGQIENVDFRLERRLTGTLTGRIFLPDGQTPAVGVWVIPFVRGRTWPDLSGVLFSSTPDEVRYEAGVNRAAVTDTEGRYRIEGLEVGEYGLYAMPHEPRERVGFPERPADAPPLDERLAQTASTVSTMVQVTADQKAELNLTLGQAGRLVGMVRAGEDGRPLPEVKVIATAEKKDRLHFWFEGFLTQRLEAITDAEGRFRLDGLDPGSYRVSAERSGWRGDQPGVEVQPGGEPAAVEIRMWELHPAKVMGRVVLPDGTSPAPLATAFLVNEFYGYATNHTEVDEEGRFELSSDWPGRYRVGASKIGYALALSEPLDLPPGRTVTDLTLRLAEPATVRGQVKWEAGQPEAGNAAVVVTSVPRSLGYLQPSQFWSRREQALYQIVDPDGEGKFEVSGVQPGANQVVVFVNDVPRAQPTEIEVPAGGTVEGVTLTVPPANGVVSGRVLAADGETPLAGASVSVYNEWNYGSRLQTKTDEAGRYTLSGISPGSYTVSAQAEGRATQLVYEVALGETPREGLDFRLPVGGTVTGRVTKPDGAAIADAWVKTYPGGDWNVPLAPGLSYGWTGAKADGTYTLEHLAPGAYTLYAWAPGWAEAQKENVVVREGETTEGIDFVLRKEP